MATDNDHVNNHIDSDINNDEVRRELRRIDEAQRGVDRAWRRTLHRMFDPDGGFSDDTRAQVLGVPSRRQFLRIGGVSIAGAALIAACGDDGGSPASTGSTTTGAPAGGATTMDPDMTDSGAMDLTLAKTAASLEALAVATYTIGIDSGLVTTTAIGSAATLFQEHHRAHLDALNALIEQIGAVAVTEPNAAVKSAVVDPAASAAKTEADIVNLALTLEDAAAQTYVFAATQLSAPELRSTIMTIGGVEARHRALLIVLAQGKPATDVFPAAFLKAENPLPVAALIS